MRLGSRFLPILIGGLVVVFAVFVGAKTVQFPRLTPPYPTSAKAILSDGLYVDGVSSSAIAFSSFKGKVVLVNFWATWCPPCVAEMPHFSAIANAYPKDLVVVGISVDNPPTPVKQFLKRHAVQYPIGLQNEGLQRVFGELPAIPTTFVLDRELRVVTRVIGYQSFSDLDTLIKPYL